MMECKHDLGFVLMILEGRAELSIHVCKLNCGYYYPDDPEAFRKTLLGREGKPPSKLKAENQKTVKGD
jgi:hypothetical protein